LPFGERYARRRAESIVQQPRKLVVKVGAPRVIAKSALERDRGSA
jgi:hypothetical protein